MVMDSLPCLFLPAFRASIIVACGTYRLDAFYASVFLLT